MCFVTSCDFEEPYNRMPCENTFKGMFKFCDTTFQKRSWGMTPAGFQAQGEYDSTSVDCSKWHIRLGIQTCEQAILDNKYVENLSQSVFSDSLNQNIQAIFFTLDECNLQNGQTYAEYRIYRKDLINGIPPLFRNKEIKRIEKTGITTNSLDTDTTGNFLIDYLPENPDSIAKMIWLENQNFTGINIEVQNTKSKHCEKIEFSYTFK